ncbi:MAG TPA: hypothetical protein GXZ55_01120 [Natronincola sp.]|nr:hypothetical protein [Natronincola sp.]
MIVRKIIHTDQAPEAVGPYSQGIKAGDLLFISGQLGVNMDTGDIDYDSISNQTKAVLKNLESIAKAGGSSLEQTVKVTIYLTNMDDFDLVNKIYANYFPHDPPARVCVEVSRLPKGVCIEMDAIVLCND